MRLHILRFLAPAVVAALATTAAAQQRASRPNFVVILVDDMGISDLSVTGHPTIRTPHLDQMAHEGLRLTSMYAAPACTPARGMFITGRYPVRTGLLWPTGPADSNGIRPNELTIAGALHAQGYRTAMFGKWHLGDFDSNVAFNPTKHGFDTFLGIPYSHDYNPPKGVPLYRDLHVVEQPVVHSTMTRRFTEETVRFIHESVAARNPFFIYLAHPMPHIPVASSEEFRGHSLAGRYGDVIEELDWSVGQVMAALKERHVDSNTVMVFMSDNGPWVDMGNQTYDRGDRGVKAQGEVGWAGLFRGGKLSTWEGGMRVPGIVRWPGVVAGGGVSSDMVAILDWFPTFVHLAGGVTPSDPPVDGLDMSEFLRGNARSPRKDLYYFVRSTMEAVRDGEWKLRLPGGPQLFNLNTDPAERYDVAASHPDIVARLQAKMSGFR